MNLCELTASQMRLLIQRRELSPVELLDACIERIETLNPAFNAIVARCVDRARQEAKRAQAQLQLQGPQGLGLLHGIPIAIKDLTETAGLRTTFGSPRFRDHVPAKDESVVAAIRGCGGIVLAKTNTPEFGIGGNTTNRVYGATRNPFNPELTSGGSSGGAAVAVATGMVPLATGTDSGGSLRNPAAFCGVVGLRPTPGLIPSERRAQGWSPMGVHGPMARNVADAALLLQAMISHDTCDPLSYPQSRRFDQLDDVALDELTLGLSTDLGFAPVDAGVVRTFRDKLTLVAPLFKECRDLELSQPTAERASWILRCLYLLATHADKLASFGDELEPRLRENLHAARRLSMDDVAWAVAEQTRVYRAFEQSLRGCSVLVCPAAAVPPFPVDCLYPATINNAPLDHYAQWMAITYGITLVGHPALVIPCGRDDAGLPFGIQLVARPHQDHLLMRIGHAIESQLARDPRSARPTPPTERFS